MADHFESKRWVLKNLTDTHCFAHSSNNFTRFDDWIHTALTELLFVFSILALFAGGDEFSLLSLDICNQKFYVRNLSNIYCLKLLQ